MTNAGQDPERHLRAREAYKIRDERQHQVGTYYEPNPEMPQYAQQQIRWLYYPHLVDRPRRRSKSYGEHTAREREIFDLQLISPTDEQWDERYRVTIFAGITGSHVEFLPGSDYPGISTDSVVVLSSLSKLSNLMGAVAEAIHDLSFALLYKFEHKASEEERTIQITLHKVPPVRAPWLPCSPGYYCSTIASFFGDDYRPHVQLVRLPSAAPELTSW
jgi:hypothetical protein